MTQVRRALQQLGQKPTDLERYIYLIQLLDTDETLFYKVLMSDPARRGKEGHTGFPRPPRSSGFDSSLLTPSIRKLQAKQKLRGFAVDHSS